MISIIITSFKEPQTIGRAIESFLKQKIKNYEIIVSAPDEETLNVARYYQKKNKKIKIIKDSGKGKPAALNKAFRQAKGEIIILSDGDVYVSSNSVEHLIDHFKDKKIGAVSGRIISINSRKSMFGYWAFATSEAFHRLRGKKSTMQNNIICSGYLYAIRKSLAGKIPENILADDAFISERTIKKGFRTVYEPEARVFVKYPDSLPDWIRQKKRTAGRYYQLARYFNISRAESIKDEILSAIGVFLDIKDVKEIYWFFLL